MHRLSSIVALFLLLATATPVLACMTDSTMSIAETTCCHAMHGKCGKMEKMKCCRTEFRTADHPQIATESASIDCHGTIIGWLTSSVITDSSSTASSIAVHDEHSPPRLVGTRTIVLRI
jgi:hypothetical protein